VPLFRRQPKPRHARRILVRQEVRITPDGSALPFDVLTGNLSASGMFVPMLAPLSQGSELDFELELGHQVVYGRAEVVWMRELEEGPERPAGMGLRFLELAGQGERLLARFVDAHVQGGATVQVGALPPAASDRSALRGLLRRRPSDNRADGGAPRGARRFRILALAVLLVVAIVGGGVVLAPRVGETLRAVLAAPAGETSERVAAQAKAPPVAVAPPPAFADPMPPSPEGVDGAPPSSPAETAPSPPPPEESTPLPATLEPRVTSPLTAPPPEVSAAAPAEAEPPPASGPFTGVDDILIRRRGSDLVVTLVADGPLPRWDHLRLDSGKPREVIRLYGVTRPYVHNRLPVDEPELRQIRTGYHEDDAGDQLHVVLDLAGPGVRMVAMEPGESTLALHLRQE
jgi:hypothetical protein